MVTQIEKGMRNLFQIPIQIHCRRQEREREEISFLFKRAIISLFQRGEEGNSGSFGSYPPLPLPPYHLWNRFTRRYKMMLSKKGALFVKQLFSPFSRNVPSFMSLENAMNLDQVVSNFLKWLAYYPFYLPLASYPFPHQVSKMSSLWSIRIMLVREVGQLGT